MGQADDRLEVDGVGGHGSQALREASVDHGRNGVGRGDRPFVLAVGSNDFGDGDGEN